MKINSVMLETIANRESQYPTDNKKEFLLVGRSNVGKSSFINTILNKRGLARTSATPGKTQTINFYLANNTFYIVDVPGYGYAATSKEVQKKFGMMIEEYLKNRDNLQRVFLLVDSRHKIMEDDLLMFNFIKYHNLDVTIVATKCDKLKQSDRAKLDSKFNEAFELANNDNIVYFSSVTKEGKDMVHKIISECLDTK